MKTIHNKLVRDLIPDIIRRNGECSAYNLLINDSEYISALKNKLIEECEEYIESGNIEEIADILEVIDSILKVHDISSKQMDKIKTSKKDKRGGFDNRIFLIETYDYGRNK